MPRLDFFLTRSRRARASRGSHARGPGISGISAPIPGPDIIDTSDSAGITNPPGPHIGFVTFEGMPSEASDSSEASEAPTDVPLSYCVTYVQTYHKGYFRPLMRFTVGYIASMAPRGSLVRFELEDMTDFLTQQVIDRMSSASASVPFDIRGLKSIYHSVGFAFVGTNDAAMALSVYRGPRSLRVNGPHGPNYFQATRGPRRVRRPFVALLNGRPLGPRALALVGPALS